MYDEAGRENEEKKEPSRLFPSRKSLETQWRHRSDDSEKVKDLQNQLDGGVAKERRAQVSVKFLQIQLYTVQATVASYHGGFPDVTKRIRTAVTDGIGGFPCTFPQKARKLITKQQRTKTLTVKADIEAVDVFLCSSEFKLSRAGPFSYHERN